MFTENNRLDLAALETAYQPVPLPPHKRADGLRFILGQENAAVAIDVFPESPPLVVVRARGSEELISLAGVNNIAIEEQGIRITNKQSDCLVGSGGHIIFTRTPPLPVPKPFIEGRSVLHYDKDGVPYQQSTLDIAGSPEGVRVYLRGMVKVAPKQESKGKNQPLTFVLEEVDKSKGVAVEHEVYATRKARADLQQKQLKRGDTIEAILFRHTYQVPTVNGEELTHTRHNLATITKVERKDAKRISKDETSSTRPGKIDA